MSANDIRELENLDRIPAELGGDLSIGAKLRTQVQIQQDWRKPNEEILELGKGRTVRHPNALTA